MTTIESAAGRPRDARIDAAVLDATRELLTEVGYAELSLTAVAARAGTSVPAVRRRWPGKAHIVHHAVFPADRVVLPRSDDTTLRDEVALVVDNCVRLVADPAMRRAIAGLLGDLAADDALQRELTARMALVVWADLADRLADAARRDGVELTLDPAVIAETAFGSTLMASVLRGGVGLDERWRMRLTDMLLASGN